KDFDVVTSATPNDIKRLFRNCRIIGRRFRLAHIFFGPKIIETSTFRANPREIEEEEGGETAETESGDLLIRRDNGFGTPEEEAALHRARFWGYMAALDRSSAVRPVPPSNALLLAVLVLPRLRDALDPDTNGVRDIGQLVSQVFAQALDRLRPSRRDTEITRNILLALRYILVSKSGRKRGRPPSREFLD